ncbi:hypothetical protein [Prosthecobacter fusiformis]|nr:hypothetical protein [Prosthecobacter fusiformis]
MKHIWIITLFGLVSCHRPSLTELPQQGSAMQGRIIVSGFEPFDGRRRNASYQIAQLVAKAGTGRDITVLEVPVHWGAPEKALASQKARPWTLWLAFGEGTNIFQIETVANNRRINTEDNNDQKPSQAQMIKGAPEKLTSLFPAAALCDALVKRGLPVRVSVEAGNYLCEEMLFNLLHSQAEVPGPAPVVLFIHTPVLGAKVKMPDGSERLMNEDLLGKFAAAILPAIEESLLNSVEP